MKIWLYSIFASVWPIVGCAQTDSLSKKVGIEVIGFVDVFGAYATHRPADGQRYAFAYNHNRQGQMNLNLALAKVAIVHQRVRASVALHAGTYVADNYAAEPEAMRYVSEAQIGVALSPKARVWFDAGIMPSHIGFESAISADNATLTRSILAENSPYYLAAAKLSWQPNDSWRAAALVCNGWQRIKPLPGNTLPGFGTQLSYTPNNKFLLNWSTFIGTDSPDTARVMRYFSNLYAVINPQAGRFTLTAGFDIGLQQKANGSNNYAVWYSPVLIGRMAFSNQWAMALRGEWYSDAHQVMISAPTNQGLECGGASINLDYAPIGLLLARIEARWLGGAKPLFTGENGLLKNSVSVVGSLALRFGHAWVQIRDI